MEEKYKELLQQAPVLQLATFGGKGPWACSLYFVVHEGKIYWLSEPHRQHSKDLAQKPQSAIAVALKNTMPVIGLQMQGAAETVAALETVRLVLNEYIAKYGVGDAFYERFEAGENKHQLYCFAPQNILVFDETKQKENAFQLASL